MKISRNWLQKYFDKPLPSAEDIDHELTFHAFEIEEIEEKNGDQIIDVKVLANRAGDALSHRGIAKELSAILNVPVKKDPLRISRKNWPASAELQVSIDDQKLCDRYIGTVLKGVKVGPSPEWLKTALENVGQRSINNVVDATNFVMLDLGQPLHAFDANTLSKKDGKWNICVRNAKAGEKITTLSNEERELSPENLLITDGHNDAVLGIGGVKGGKTAEVTESTTDIILEAAHFNYASVRKTAQRLRLPTDASKRFENNLSPEMAGYGMDAVTTLIQEIAGGEVEGTVDVYPTASAPVSVSVSASRINGVLGTSIGSDEILSILERLDLPAVANGETITVAPPFERVDIRIPEDVIEEVGRIYGYEHVQAVPLPAAAPVIELNKRFYYAERIRSVLIAHGYNEIMTYALQNKGEVEIANPLASDKAFLRANLRKGMEAALDVNIRNTDLLGTTASKLFEIGTVFNGSGEYSAIAIGIGDPKGKKATEDALEAEALEILRSIVPEISDVFDKGIGEWNFDELTNVLLEPKEYDKVSVLHNAPKYKTISVYPYIIRDIAVWIPEGKEAAEAEEIIRANAGELLMGPIRLVDTFGPKDGRTSYAFRMVFQSYERTLSDSEVNVIMDNISTALNSNQGWQVR